MIFCIIITTLSFLLDSYISMYIPISVTNNNILVPMFTIISLIIIYPYSNNNIKGYLTICLMFGLLYDITFTNTLGLNIALFFSIGYLISSLDSVLSNNLLSLIIKMMLIIIFYDVITYLILLLLNYIDYSVLTLVIKIGKSILLNTIYLTSIYLITNLLSNKLNIKKSI